MDDKHSMTTPLFHYFCVGVGSSSNVRRPLYSDVCLLVLYSTNNLLR